MDFITNIEIYLAFFQSTSNVLNVLFILFCVFTLIQVIYYLLFYIPVTFKKNKYTVSKKEPVSIVICAKNEEENLRINLPKILSQNYPEFEVIVINDCSNDNTEEFLGELSQKYSNLKFSSLVEDNKFNHGKKLALTIGIKAAKHDILLLTDADCYPKTDNWISSMQELFIDKKDIVLGYGGYENKKGVLNKLIRFDTVFVAMQYLGFANIGIPYMGVGRNLSYRKSLFFNNKGFASHSHILSGDDDLFINQTANNNNISIAITNDSHTLSAPKTTINEWFKQKRRHLSTGKHYKLKHKILLALEPFSRILFYLLFAILVITNYKVELLISLFVFRLILLYLATKLIMNKFQEKSFWLMSLFFDIYLPFINFYFLISNHLLRKNNKWK